MIEGAEETEETEREDQTEGEVQVQAASATIATKLVTGKHYFHTRQGGAWIYNLQFSSRFSARRNDDDG